MRKVILLLIMSAWCAQAGLSKLDAISMIETGDNDRAVGSLGEVSRYQILPRVWKVYTRSWNYRNPNLAAIVAEKHLTVLEEGFKKKTGREPTDFDRYVLWNAGLSYYARKGFSPTKVHRVIRDRANRYVNLRHMKQQVP